MQEFFTILTLASLITLIGITLLTGRKNSSSNSFVLLLVAICLWTISNYFSLNSETQSSTLLWIRIVMGVSCGIGNGVLILTSLFPDNKPATSKTALIAGNLFILIVAVISARSDWVIRGVSISSGIITPIFGEGILLFIFTIVFTIAFSSYFAFKKYLKASIIEKRQLTYLFSGLGLTIILGLLTNFILVAYTGSSEFVALGPFFSLIFCFLTFLAIRQHKLFEIRFLLGRVIYFTLLGLIPYISFFLVVILFQKLYEGIFNIFVYLSAVPIAIGFVVLFNYINNYIKNSITSRLINPGYNPAESVERLSNEISLLLELKNIASLLSKMIMRTVRPDFVEIVIFGDKDRKVSRRVFTAEGMEKLETSSIENSLLIAWETVGRHPILYDNLESEKQPEGIFFNSPNIATELLTLMEELELKFILPLYTKEKIKGVILIGKKEADYPYTRQDIDFLQSLATTTSVAIERSLLYTEVQQFANTLQGRVEEATKELLNANNRLQKALVQVQEARRRERDMMDVMGHELRTPISIVRNALAMLQRESKKDPEGGVPKEIFHKYVDMGLESARREIRLIETLLSATKVDASRLQLFFTRVDFRDVIEDGIEGQKMHLAKKPIEIEYNPPENEVAVYCDRTRVQEIVDNFLSNAAKYTMKGKVTIKTWQDNEFGWISVKDTGIGVAEQDLQKLGKKFFRARQYIGEDEDTKVVRPGGTGLGLYVTFELIRVMGGQLYINSEIGKGTTFTFSIPNFTGQPDKQFDQTFDQDTNKDRKHITINGMAPKAPE